MVTGVNGRERAAATRHHLDERAGPDRSEGLFEVVDRLDLRGPEGVGDQVWSSLFTTRGVRAHPLLCIQD